MAKNNLLNKKLRSEQNLPDGFAWDQMGDGILEKMPMKPLHKSPSVIGKFLSAFFAVSVIVGFIIYYNADSGNSLDVLEGNNEISVVNNQNKSNETKELNRKTKKINTNLNTQETKQLTFSPETSRAEGNHNNINTTQQRSATRLKSVEKKSSANQKIDLSQNNVSNNVIQLQKSLIIEKVQSEKVQSDNMSQTLNPSSYTQSSASALPNTSAQTETQEAFTKLERLEEIEKSIYFIEQAVAATILVDLPMAKGGSSGEIVEPKGKANRVAIELGVGPTYWLANNKGGDIAEAKSQHEKALISYGTNVSLSYRLSKGWSISSGIGYQKMESLTDYQSAKKDTTILQSLEYKNATIRRRVLYNNKYTSYNVPLMLHKSWGNGPLEFVVGLGINYRFNVQASGRSLGNDTEGNLTVVHLDKLPALNQNNWNAQGQLALKHSFCDDFYTGAALNISSPLSKFSFGSITQKPMWMQGQVMIGMRL